MNAVERALVAEAVNELNMFMDNDDVDAVYRARRAINILWEYLHDKNLPATHDEDGEVLNHGRCVD